MKSLTLLLFTLLIMFVIGCQEKKAEPVPVGEMQEYRDPGYNFKIKYPTDWKQMGTIGKAVFAKSDDVILRFQDFKSGIPGGMVTVTVLELKGRTPQDVIISANDELKQYAQMQPEQQVTVSGKSASKIPYSYQATKKIQVQGFLVHVIGDTAVYDLEFKGYGDQWDAHQALFTAMLNSFQLPVVVAKKSDVWQAAGTTSPYTSDYFSMEYPENMNFAPVKKGDKDLVVELRADRLDCSVHIDVFGAKKLNVDKVWEQNKGHYKARGTGKSTIDGNTAYWVDYSLVKDINSRAYFMVKNDKVIRVTINWYAPQKEVYFPAFEKIVNSMKLK